MEETKLRKYEHMLVISGAGVIAFGIWSVVKAAIFFIVMPAEQMSAILTQKDLMDIQSIGFTVEAVGYMMAGGIMIGLLVDLWVRFYIGRSAVRDGRGIRRKSPVYIIMAGMLGVGLILGTVNTFVFSEMNDAQQTILDTVDVSVIVDLTSLLALIQMIVAAVMVRRIRKRLPPGRREVV